MSGRTEEREELDFYNFLTDVVWLLWDREDVSPLKRQEERTTEENLKDYRAKMGDIQSKFFFTALSRNLLISLIGLAKIRDGRPVYDEVQHKRVIAEWDERCEQLGMPESLRKLMHQLIVEVMDLSVSHQEAMAADSKVRRETVEFIKNLHAFWVRDKRKLRRKQQVLARENSASVHRPLRSIGRRPQASA